MARASADCRVISENEPFCRFLTVAIFVSSDLILPLFKRDFKPVEAADRDEKIIDVARGQMAIRTGCRLDMLKTARLRRFGQ
jgi:hypothetical protein